jgi:molecular chaperone DnaK (HSP70)
MDELIGVEFGTTKSVVAALHADGTVQTARIGLGAAMLAAPNSAERD